jgi:hypothetical protein
MSSSYIYEKRIEIPSECQISLEGRTAVVHFPIRKLTSRWKAMRWWLQQLLAEKEPKL